MKVSVSLPEKDVDFLDQYSKDHGLGSRSAALSRAIDAIREKELAAAYAAAWQEWSGSEDAELWDSVSGDGL